MAERKRAINLTLKDKLVYQFLMQRKESGAHPPTIREIIDYLQIFNDQLKACKEFGFLYDEVPSSDSTSSIFYTLQKLGGLGLIKGGPRRRARKATVTGSNRNIPVPVLRYKK